MLFPRFFILLVFLCCCSPSAVTYGQSSERVTSYLVETGALGASAQTPFWLRANKYGVVPLQSPFGWVNTGIWSDYRGADSSGRRKADWGYGVNAIINAGAATQVLLPEAYIKGRLGAFELYLGRRREINGLVDTLLTTGAYSWSGNALPIPKIQLALPTYTPVPFTKGVISVLGAYSHGWFENSDRYIKGSYLHQTYFYGRLGKPTWRFRLYGGFTHQAIWAGQADPPGIIPPYLSDNGKLPSAFKYYPAVVIGERGLFSADDPDVTSFEANRIGNHLGSVDFAADVNVAHWNVFMYRQFMYDDGSLFYLTNIQDGLNGIRLKNQKTPDGETFFLRQVTLEYLYTGSQGGNEFVIDDPKRRGNDDYFNHAQFIDGWTYFGRTIGNPFLTPTLETNPNLPLRPGITNNRVSAGHFGLSALLFGAVDVIAKASYSVNAGTYPAPFLEKPRQFSGFLSAGIPVNVFGGTTLSAALAVDAGGLLPNSIGGSLSLRKAGFLGGKKPDYQRSSPFRLP